MEKYLVKLSDAKHRDGLAAKFEKVGSAMSMPDLLIVQTDQGIDAIRKCEGVLLVEPDESAEILDAGWGLPWISNTGGTYVNDKTGAGVDIYVLDTGVRDTHSDLAGRVRTLYSFDGVPYSLVGGQSPTHGTSVSGCAAGTIYGTAKQAQIVNCRIDFQTTTILKALDMILRDHLDKPDDIPSVLNFSGSSVSGIIGAAFERLTKYGIVIIAAAGNSSEPSPRYPARNMWVVAVGAINKYEGPAWFTNRTCDVYAPGQDVVVPSVFSDGASSVMSGTSFSSPYYAGLLACLLEGSDKFNTSKHVSDFTFVSRNQLMEQKRIPSFTNGGLPVRTATTNGFGGIYYVSPLKNVSDADIAAWLIANAGNPQLVADTIKDYNLSLSRLDRVAGPDIGIIDINQYFSDAGVTPWWHTV